MVLLTEIASVKIVSSIDALIFPSSLEERFQEILSPRGDGFKKTSLGSLFGNQGWFGWKG
jgi:hypothetical protein